MEDVTNIASEEMTEETPAPAEEKKEKKAKKVKEPKAPKAPKEPKAPKVKKVKEPKEGAESKAAKDKNGESAVKKIFEKICAGIAKFIQMAKDKKAGKYSPLSSFKVKISILVAVALVLASAVITVVMVSSTKKTIIDATYAKMTTTVNSFGLLVSDAEIAGGNKKALAAEAYEVILKDATVKGVDDFYVYLMNSAGITSYHTDASRIGKPNKIEAVNFVITELNKGHHPEGEQILEYVEGKKTMYASYYITGINSVLVVCADGAELMRPITRLVAIAVSMAFVILILALIATWFVAGAMTKPIDQVTKVINETANLKLSIPVYMESLCKRTDETGIISRAVRDMSANLYNVVEKIDNANIAINENMRELEESSNQVHMFCTDNSATTEELAASASEVSNMTAKVAELVEEMKRRFQLIDNETVNSNKESEEIAKRAQNLQLSTAKAITDTKEMYEQIRSKTSAAIEGLKAVKKINELTDAIMDIADQTRLLSLNASIEAARAGEAGRGFAVVASEINNLAQRSSQSVKDINDIIKEINGVVENISVNMNATTEFLEKDVLGGYDNFNKTGAQYLEDAHTFKAGMSNISSEAENLNEAIRQVSEAVERIKVSMEETSLGVSNIAEKNGNVVDKTKENYELTRNSMDHVDALKEIVNKFEF